MADSERDLALDADAVLQFALNHLHISPDRLHFYGWSLGGGVAANMLALHPECRGKLILDRTFSSIVQIADRIGRRLLGRFGALLARSLIHVAGWNLDTLSAVRKMGDRTICVATHPEDEIIGEGMRMPSAGFHSVTWPSESPRPHRDCWRIFSNSLELVHFLRPAT